MQSALPFSNTSGAGALGGFHSAVTCTSLTGVYFLLFVNYIDSLVQASGFPHVYEYKYLFKSLFINKIQISPLQNPMLPFITHI